MTGFPGLTELLKLMRQQSDAMKDVPRTLGAVQGAVRELTQAANRAHETTASAQVIVDRLANLLDELEPAVRALKPGLERVGRVLDDPAVDTIPGTLTRVHDDLMPLIHGLRQAQAKMTSLTGIFRRRDRSRLRTDEDRARASDDVTPGAGSVEEHLDT
jgi:hypothetical protein